MQRSLDKFSSCLCQHLGWCTFLSHLFTSWSRFQLCSHIALATAVLIQHFLDSWDIAKVWRAFWEKQELPSLLKILLRNLFNLFWAVSHWETFLPCIFNFVTQGKTQKPFFSFLMHDSASFQSSVVPSLATFGWSSHWTTDSTLKPSELGHSFVLSWGVQQNVLVVWWKEPICPASSHWIGKVSGMLAPQKTSARQKATPKPAQCSMFLFATSCHCCCMLDFPILDKPPIIAVGAFWESKGWLDPSANSIRTHKLHIGKFGLCLAWVTSRHHLSPFGQDEVPCCTRILCKTHLGHLLMLQHATTCLLEHAWMAWWRRFCIMLLAPSTLILRHWSKQHKECWRKLQVVIPLKQLSDKDKGSKS